MIKNNLLKAVALVLCFNLVGCARTIDSNVYSEASVGEASFTYQGAIISVRKVQVHGAERLEDNKTGMAIGGVGGAIAGSTMGRGAGNVGATVGLGILGATVGSLIEKKLKQQDAIEYAVKLTNGQLMTIVQGLDTIFSVGQNVFVIVSHDGRSRIVADNSGTHDVQTPIAAPQVKINKKR